MDSRVESDGAQGQGKGRSALDALSKEDLIKKYKQALLIAQKAKESKTEFLKHIAQNEERLRALEEKLHLCEEEKQKEIDLRTRVEAEFKQARDLITNTKSESPSTDKDLMNVDDASQLSIALDTANSTIKRQEHELLDMKSELKALSNLKSDLENIVFQKENEIKSLQSIMEKREDIAEKCIRELKYEMKRLQDGEKSVADLCELVEKQKDAIAKFKSDLQGVQNDLEGKMAENSKLLMEAASNNEELQVQLRQISNLSSELKHTRDRAEMLQSESTSKFHQLQSEHTVVLDKLFSLESEKAKHDEERDEFKKQIHDVKEELNKSIMEKNAELESLREAVRKEEEPCQTCEKLLKDEEKRRNEDEATNKKFQDLQLDIANYDERTVMLQSTIDKLQAELSETHKIVEESQKEVAKLINQLALSKEEEKSNTELITNLKAEIKVKEQELSEKCEEIEGKEDLLNTLATQQGEKEALEKSLNEKHAELQKQQEYASHLQTEMQSLQEKLADKESLLKNMQKQEKAESSKTIPVASPLGQDELREQINNLQDVLRSKESLVHDLEQELNKLRDTLINESTNTEVSSTFSFSRAEELSRMKDLEDSFEDKYTKLRVVAVKLKKRVTDLTQTLENERAKSASERAELQGKISHLASHAKTVQTLQSEVDRLQDLIEEQKKTQQQVNKLLEAAVKESASKKFELASVQDELLRISKEKKSLETSLQGLESSLTNANTIRIEIDKLGKELQERDVLLESLKEEKLKLAGQLEEIGADAKKKSVLSLEMADMEKSVSKLTSELSSERDLVKKTKLEFEEEHSSFLSLNNKFKDLEVKLNEKEMAYNELKDSLAGAKGNIESLQSKCTEKEKAVEQLSSQLENQQALVEELNIQLSDLAAQQVQTKETGRRNVEKLSRQVFQLEEHCSLLKDSHKALEDELASVRTEFENYKVRAQSVLRQSVKQEERAVSSSTLLNAEELEVEVECLRVNVNSLKANLQQTTSQLQAALQELNVEREEKVCALKQAQINKESCAQAVERQHAAEGRLSIIAEESKQAKLQSETLVQCYKQQLEDLKANQQKKIASLTEQIETLQASIRNPASMHGEGDHASSVQSGPSPVADWAAQLPNAPQSDTDLAMRLSSLQREEGEGSESVDSFPSRRISVTAQDRRHELVPLDKLLSSPTYPDDDRDVPRANSSDLSVDLLQSKLSACEARASHLTALLSEAESDAARLSQLNTVLKEEIRRQQRCEERAQHAHNLEYLKNVVVKFITLQNGDERQRLIPVLNTILKLSPEEAGLVETAAKGTSQASTGGGWGSYLPLPGWGSS